MWHHALLPSFTRQWCSLCSFTGARLGTCPTMLARLEGFHIRAAYRMSWKHKPHQGLFGNWIYPSTKDVLKECGLHPVKDYIDTRRSTIAMYVVNRPIFWECQGGEWMRGSMPGQWWREQELSLDV